MATSSISYVSNLDVNIRPSFVRLSGIVCTIGPVSKDSITLEKMLAAGMNIARLNFSHGTRHYHAEMIQNIRKAAVSYGQKIGMACPVAIAIDTKGAEIRTGLFEKEQAVILERNETITLTTEDSWQNRGTKSQIYVDYPDIVKVITEGDTIYIDDGLISLICVRNNEADGTLVCRVENGGVLGTCKGVNLPGTETHRPVLSAKDEADIQFGLEQGIDIILVSFTRCANDVRRVRELISASSNRQTLVVAKIESQCGINNVDEIVDSADGILMDRGDLGMEIGLQKVFLAQKVVIAKCNMAGKPVVMATHMLESMISRPRPTRAESSDVANAVLDGADCVMLSGETANGTYPVESVQVMAAACVQAEAVIWQKRLFCDLTERVTPPVDVLHATAIAAVHAAILASATAIIVITMTGKSAQMISRYRPRCPIVAVTRNDQVARHLHLFRAILPVYYDGSINDGDWEKNVQVRTLAGIQFGKTRGFIKTGDVVIIVTGWKQGPGSTNTLSTLYVED